MNWPTRLTTFHVSLIALAASLFANVEASAAANTAKIQQAITKAQNYILRQHLASPQGTIAALAYVKSGGDKKHPAVDQAVQFVLKKVEDGVYQPGDHFNYEAGVDIMLLEAVDVETYRHRWKRSPSSCWETNGLMVRGTTLGVLNLIRAIRASRSMLC